MTTLPRKLRGGIPIIALSAMALISALLSSVFSRFTFYTLVEQYYRTYYELVFRVTWHDLILFFSDLVPFVVWFVYLTVFYKQYKATALVPVTLLLIDSSQLYDATYASPLVVIRCAFLFLTFAFAWAAFSACKGFPKKTALIVAVIAGLLLQIAYLLNFVGWAPFYTSQGRYLYLAIAPTSIFSNIALYVSLLLFGLKNRIPALISPRKRTISAEPAHALKLLNRQLEVGEITAEEYQAQRAEIIRNL